MDEFNTNIKFWVLVSAAIALVVPKFGDYLVWH